MGKLISIVIPCFNVERYINRCLTSIVNQTIGIENLEVIVVDDASCDSTWNILLEWEQKYPDNFVIIQHEFNKKQGAARNTGLYYVTSPYISFVDADDWIESTMLELMYTKITAMNLDAIGCGYHRAVSDNDTIKEKTGKGLFYDYSSETQKRKLILHGCPGYVSGKLYRTSLIQEYQIFFPEQCYYEDIDWKDQFSLYLTRYYELEDKLYYYFVNPESTTMQSKCSRHFDRFLVELNRLERYKELEVFEKYKNEIEFHFIKIFYLNSLFIFLSRCNDFTPKILSYMQSTLKTKFPNYKKNCYLESELVETDQYLLKTVEWDLSQSDLNKLTISLRKDLGGKTKSSKKILMIKGISQYDAMRIYIDELATAFEQEGNLCTVLDGTSKDFQDEIFEAIQNHSYDYVLTCNGILMSPAVRKLLKAKYCTWIFDHPIHHMERLQQGDENTIVLCCDRNNVNYVRRYFPNLTHVDFVPLSGSCVEDIVPYRERTIDLVFTGSNLMAADAMKCIQEITGPIKDIALEMVDMIHSKTSLTLEESLAIVLNNHNISVDDRQFQDILFCTQHVSRYMRAFYREKIVQTIVDAGIPIHVFGSGWDMCDFSKKSNFIQCEGFGQTSLRAVANSKISLNVMPWFKDGFQERIAAAMLNGAISLTDSSKYINENFIDRENIRLYSLDKIELLPSIIQELLDNVDQSEQIAQNGYCIAKAQHTYKNRAQQISRILDKMF